MQSIITSGTEDKSIEQVLDRTQKGKGKKRSEEIAVESLLDPPMTASTITAHADPTSTDPPSGTPTPLSLSRLPLPPHLASETPSIQHRSRSRPTSRDTSPYPRSRPSTPNPSSTPGPSSPRTVGPRRSQRTLAKAPDRPRGPPELEAALAIAIRNLESDVYAWWCTNQKPGSPIPTTAYLKGRSPRIRKAAAAVDEADRLLNEAVYGKPKKARAFKKAQVLPPGRSGDVTPDTAFEQLELNSQHSSPLRPVAVSPAISTETDSGGGSLLL